MTETHEYYWRLPEDGDDWRGPFKTYRECAEDMKQDDVRRQGELECRPKVSGIIRPRDGELEL